MATWVGLREVGDVAILSVVGKLTLSDGTQDVRMKVREVVDRGVRRLVLNLNDVPYLDSAGIGELVAAKKAMEHRGGQMKLLEPGKTVRDALRVVKLDRVLDFCQDEAAALASFRI
ncbi:MAG: STAS domain-containing protein [Bryobacteraceae bacterium]